MAWYYYSGTVVRPIPLKKGLSKSVRPKSKVEILEMTVEVQALIRKGQLRLTGKPKGAPSVADAPVPQKKVADVMGKSAMAKKIAEKGTTTSATIPPISKNPEQTEGEQIAEEKGQERGESGDDAEGGDENEDDEDENSSKKIADSAEEVDQAEVLNKNQKKKRIKRRRK